MPTNGTAVTAPNADSFSAMFGSLDTGDASGGQMTVPQVQHHVGQPSQLPADAGAADGSGVVAPPGAAQPEAMVPSHRLRQEADRARAAEHENALLRTQMEDLVSRFRSMPQQQPLPQQAQQPQHSVPDLISDPVGYAEWLMASVKDVVTRTVADQVVGLQSNVSASKLQQSDAIAEGRFGRQTIRDATAAAVNAGLKDHFMSRPDPVGEACTWFLGQSVLSTYGGDAQTVRHNVAVELLGDPQFMAAVQSHLASPGAQASQGQRGIPQSSFAPQQPQRQALPPSLSGQPTNGAGGLVPGAIGDIQSSLSSMFASRDQQWFGARA